MSVRFRGKHRVIASSSDISCSENQRADLERGMARGRYRWHYSIAVWVPGLYREEKTWTLAKHPQDKQQKTPPGLTRNHLREPEAEYTAEHSWDWVAFIISSCSSSSTEWSRYQRMLSKLRCQLTVRISKLIVREIWKTEKDEWR